MSLYNQVDVYLMMLREIKQAEEMGKYRDVLMISLEAVTYIPLIIAENKLSSEQLQKPLDYVINFLTVLLEEKELKYLLGNYKQEADKDSIKNLIHDKIRRALSRIDGVERIYRLISDNPGCGDEDLYGAVVLSIQEIEEILRDAIRLGIVEDSDKGYNLKIKNPSLATVFNHREDIKKVDSLFSRLISSLFHG